MKKIIYGIVTFMLLAILPTNVDAASATLKVKSGSTAVVGSTVTVNVTLSSGTAIGAWEYILNYNSSYLKLVSGSTSVADYTTSASGTKSKTYTLTFKTLKSGKTSINIGSYLVYALDESQMSVTTSSATIKIMTQAELEATYSKDNNLKELNLEGYTLTPEFNKDTLEYSATIPSDVTNVKINATANDSKASVTGDGEFEVVEGNNRFEIKVRAENGSEKTYVLNVEVEDLNPINVQIGDKTYTIIKRKDILTKPNAYEESTTNIDGVEVPCFKNEVSGFTLVGIKDENGIVSLAIYNNEKNEYQLYHEYTSNNLMLYLTKFPNDLEGYQKSTININDTEIEVYRLNENSRFVIVYGMNIETGKYDYYSYDTKENTYQIYNDEEINSLKEDVKTYLYVCIAFGSGLLFAFILIICLLSNKNKKRKKLEMRIEEKKNDQNKVEEPKETKKTNTKNKDEVKNEEIVEEKVIETTEDMHDLLKEMQKQKKKKNAKN